MKKVLPIAIILLLASWIGATWLVSNQVEQRFDEAITRFDQNIQSELPGVRLQADGFDKGLFRSQARSTLELGDGDTLPLRHAIHHGPVMFTPLGVKFGSSYIVTTLDLDRLPADRKASIERATGGETPITVGMLTGTGEDIDVDLDFAAVSLDDDDSGAKLRFGGLTGALSTNFSGDYLRGRIDTTALEIETPEQQTLVLSPARFDFDIDQMYRGTVLSGRSGFELENLALTVPQTLRIDASAIEVRSDSRRDEHDRIHGRFTLSSAPVSLDVPAKAFRLDDARLNLQTDIEGLETEAMKRLADATAALQNLDPATLERGGAAVQQSLQDYFASLAGLLRPGLKSHSDAEFGTADGKLALSLELTYSGDRPASELATLRELIHAVEGKLNLHADRPLLAALALEQAAAVPVAMGFAVEENGQLRSRIELQNSVLYINGQATPFLDMLGPALDSPSPLRGA